MDWKHSSAVKVRICHTYLLWPSNFSLKFRTNDSSDGIEPSATAVIIRNKYTKKTHQTHSNINEKTETEKHICIFVCHFEFPGRQNTTQSTYIPIPWILPHTHIESRLIGKKIRQQPNDLLPNFSQNARQGGVLQIYFQKKNRRADKLL